MTSTYSRAVFRVNDSMWCAAHAVRAIEQHASYPIESIDELGAVFARLAAGRLSVRIGVCRVEADQIVQYMPREGFPIADREQLISRAVIAFERERVELLEQISQDQDKRGTRGLYRRD